MALAKREIKGYLSTSNTDMPDCMSTTAALIRSKMEAKGLQIVEKIRKEAEERSKKYADNGSIAFPWDVLVVTAVNR